MIPCIFSDICIGDANAYTSLAIEQIRVGITPPICDSRLYIVSRISKYLSSARVYHVIDQHTCHRTKHIDADTFAPSGVSGDLADGACLKWYRNPDFLSLNVEACRSRQGNTLSLPENHASVMVQDGPLYGIICSYLSGSNVATSGCIQEALMPLSRT